MGLGGNTTDGAAEWGSNAELMLLFGVYFRGFI